jgi:hypothetical protein
LAGKLMQIMVERRGIETPDLMTATLTRHNDEIYSREYRLIGSGGTAFTGL